MQHYIDYLLEDIKKAERHVEVFEPGEIGIGDLLKHFEEIERYFTEEPRYTFGNQCGLQREQFPQPEKLSDKQMKQVLKAFDKMLNTWNINAYLPKKVPLARQYALLVTILEEKTHIMEGGTLVMDFCAGSSESCALKEYCQCLHSSRKINRDREMRRGV